MEDYEHHHAAAWLDEEELERKRQNRVNRSTANITAGIEARVGLGGQVPDISADNEAACQTLQPSKPFDIRNRNHSAYPDQVVVTQSGDGLSQPSKFTVPRREYANRARGRGGRFRGGGSAREQASRLIWYKNRAYDARREARQVNKSQEQDAIKDLQERPSNLDDYDYQLFYWWPSEDIRMEEFANHFDKRVIEDLRYGAQSWVEFDSSESLVRVWSMDEMRIRSVALRINNLVKELIAKINNSMTICFIQHPIRGIQNAVVTLHPTPDAKPAFPVLKYSPEPSDDCEDPRAAITKAENAKMMAMIVSQCVKNLRLPRQHVRMRLRIGLVTLGRRLNFSIGRQYYGFEEFASMLEQSLTETELDSLTPNGLTDLQMERISRLGILQNPLMSYCVEFHFLDATTDSMLVIRHEWQASRNKDELEMVGREWLSIPKVRGERPLEITVVDFDRADIQLGIDTFETYGQNNIVRKQLEKFENTIKFRPSPEALTATDPNPTTAFQWGIGNLQVVKEKSVMVFDIKSTTYKLAITRTDTYKADGLKTTRQYQGADFDFSIFDPDWDSNLSEFTTLSPGQEVSWKRAIVSFFNKPLDAISDDVNEGFFRFLDMAEMVVEHVQAALGISDEGAAADEESDKASGIECP